MNHYNINIKDWKQKATALSKGEKKSTQEHLKSSPVNTHYM